MKTQAILLMVLLALSACQSKNEKGETDTKLVPVEEKVAVDNPSNVYFDQAADSLKAGKNEAAARLLSTGATALAAEAKNLADPQNGDFGEAYRQVTNLIAKAKDGKLTADELTRTTDVAELLVKHRVIEQTEVLPVIQEDPLKVTLDDLEKNVRHLSGDEQTKGLQMIQGTREALEARKHAAKADSAQAEQHLRQRLSELKEYVKKHSTHS